MTCNDENIDLLTYKPFSGEGAGTSYSLGDESWEEQNLSSKTKGMGVDAIEFKANFPDACFTGAVV